MIQINLTYIEIIPRMRYTIKRNNNIQIQAVFLQIRNFDVNLNSELKTFEGFPSKQCNIHFSKNFRYTCTDLFFVHHQKNIYLYICCRERQKTKNENHLKIKIHPMVFLLKCKVFSFVNFLFTQVSGKNWNNKKNEI